MTATLQKYRIIKEPGKPVGPHVDFARDDKGNILKGPPYIDEQGRQMPGDPLEKTYFPGDEVWSTVDLTQLNGRGAGSCYTKFERVLDDASVEQEIEAAKALIAKHESTLNERKKKP